MIVNFGNLGLYAEFDERGELPFSFSYGTYGEYLNREQVKQLRDLLTKLLEEDGE